MRYSLLNRFRGAMLGTAIGEIRGAYGESWPWGDRNLAVQPNSWGRLIVRGTEGLIHHGHLDLADWQESTEPTKASHFEINKPVNSSNRIDRAVSGEMIATLPVALFFHEDEAKLRQNLQQVADVWQDDSIVKDSNLAIGYAIAQALKEKLDPVTLIPQTINYIDAETPLTKQLQQVQILLEQNAGLETTITQLSPRQQTLTANLPIALAFYCFLSTPEDLRLAVIRATHCPQPQITSAIAGALSGAYNSTAGFPVAWRLALSQPKQDGERSPLEILWGINSEAELLRLASRLLAAWSGVYDAEKFLMDTNFPPAVAAPKVIKPR